MIWGVDDVAEDKERFIEMINDALIECGDGRYDYLKDEPLVYHRDNDGQDRYETVSQGQWNVVSVTYDSLTAMMADLHDLF